MNKPKKLIVDLNAEDKEILRRLNAHLEIPIATIVRWSIRYYALHGPVLIGWSKECPNLLEGFKSLVVGLGVREEVPSCDATAKR
jgi:hypothetical protein